MRIHLRLLLAVPLPACLTSVWPDITDKIVEVCMFKTGCTFLMINGIVFIVIGLFLTFFNATPLFVIFQWILDPLFNGFRNFSEDAMAFQHLAWTFIGMFHVIWGIFIIFNAYYGLLKQEVWAWVSICLSIVTWLTVDLWFSLSTKMYLISFNPMTAFFAAIFIVPLWMTRGVFKNG
jgi:hypothetical protein